MKNKEKELEFEDEALIRLSNKTNWIMMITTDFKIKFNTKEYPEMMADDFAKEVAGILVNNPKIRETLKEYLKNEQKELKDE